MEAAAWIALVALAFTATQAWVAYRKLRFDLFAKRFETWEALNDAFNARRLKASDFDPSRPFDADDKERREIWRLERPMRALFPIDVSASLERIDKAMLTHDVALMEYKSLARVSNYANPHELGAKHITLMDAEREWREAQDELGRLVHRYVRQYGWIELVGVHVRRRAGRLWQTAQRGLKNWKR
ncbi:hypothetical protein [Methylobacterium sp. AMS5]|uniref:hypothetical protein n=1 Tax=Methylobacterium sp. AMS5 TaxID=925818 RepID=UPI00074FA59F|nr:hypothetical protein [Methylobacterium sp. AMS5]AMB48415.1 hypothetical protein Y590_25925 [Methylobacterium sp. AMS5]